MVMRLADIIKQCKEAGASEVYLHQDGSVARMVFAPAVEKPPVVQKRKLSHAEEVEKARKERNPRRDATDLALAILQDKNPGANA